MQSNSIQIQTNPAKFLTNELSALSKTVATAQNDNSDLHKIKMNPANGQEFSLGQWTEKESNMLRYGLEQYDCDWKTIQKMVKTRTVAQIRSRASKLTKVKQFKEVGSSDNLEDYAENSNSSTKSLSEHNTSFTQSQSEGHKTHYQSTRSLKMAHQQAHKSFMSALKTIRQSVQQRARPQGHPLMKDTQHRYSSLMNSSQSGVPSSEAGSRICKLPATTQLHDTQQGFNQASLHGLYDNSSLNDFAAVERKLQNKRNKVKSVLISHRDVVNTSVTFNKAYSSQISEIIINNKPLNGFLMQATALRAQANELLLMISEGYSQETLVKLHLEIKDQQKNPSEAYRWDREELLTMRESQMDSILSSNTDIDRVKDILYREIYLLRQSCQEQLNTIRDLQKDLESMENNAMFSQQQSHKQTPEDQPVQPKWNQQFVHRISNNVSNASPFQPLRQAQKAPALSSAPPAFGSKLTQFSLTSAHQRAAEKYRRALDDEKFIFSNSS